MGIRFDVGPLSAAVAAAVGGQMGHARERELVTRTEGHDPRDTAPRQHYFNLQHDDAFRGWLASWRAANWRAANWRPANWRAANAASLSSKRAVWSWLHCAPLCTICTICTMCTAMPAWGWRADHVVAARLCSWRCGYIERRGYLVGAPRPDTTLCWGTSPAVTAVPAPRVDPDTSLPLSTPIHSR